MSDIKVGDVVRLKSGGKDMTVTEINGDACLCHWFESNEYQWQKLGRAWFPAAALIMVEPVKG